MRQHPDARLARLGTELDPMPRRRPRADVEEVGAYELRRTGEGYLVSRGSWRSGPHLSRSGALDAMRRHMLSHARSVDEPDEPAATASSSTTSRASAPKQPGPRTDRKSGALASARRRAQTVHPDVVRYVRGVLDAMPVSRPRSRHGDEVTLGAVCLALTGSPAGTGVMTRLLFGTAIGVQNAQVYRWVRAFEAARAAWDRHALSLLDRARAVVALAGPPPAVPTDWRPDAH